MMKLILVGFMLLISFGNVYSQFKDSGYQQLYDSETVASFKEHVGFISAASMQGRKPGSQGEKDAATYLYEQLKAYGVDMLTSEQGEEFGIQQESGDTLVSRNVYGFIQGYDKKLRNQYIVIGARLDNLGTNQITIDGKPQQQTYYGANGNASGLAMMIELARMVSTNSVLFRRSVLFVGFGASTQTYSGAWYFLNRDFKDTKNIDAMINLDMLGTGKRGFYAYTASNTDMNSILNSLATQLHPIYPELVSYEPYPSDHRAFYSQEISSIYFTTGKYTEHNTHRDQGSIIDYEEMEQELEYIYNFTVALANEQVKPAFKDEGVIKRDPSYDDVVAYHDCDYQPTFLNSNDPRVFMQKWVYQYLKYPGEAIEQGIQGKVLVDFIIGKDGKITDVQVLKGVDPLLDEEAIRVINASPKWKPGRLNGQKVRTSMTIPVEFRLTKSGKANNFGIKKY